VDNITWHELINTKNFEISNNRFGQQIPTKILRRFVERKNNKMNIYIYYRSILIRIQSDHLFSLNHIYIGPSCPANCYGHGKCLWQKQKALCQCDNNQTSGIISLISKRSVAVYKG
jgi:hypothetical protein